MGMETIAADWIEFVEVIRLGVRMRDAQRTYLRTGSEAAAIEIQRLEAEFDAAARRVLAKAGDA